MAKMTVTRNQSIALVATVVIVLCLLFTYLTADDGSDDGFRYEEVPGDYLVVTTWDPDGDCSTHRMALISDHGEKSMYMVRTFGDIHRMIELDHGSIANILYHIPEDAVVEGNETVITPMGVSECDVYRDSEGNRYLVESHGMILLKEQYGYTTKVDITSLVGSEISDITRSRADVRVDDYLAFKLDEEGEGMVVVYDVDSIDGDGNCTISISIIKKEGVTTVERTVGYDKLLEIMGFGYDYSDMEYVCDAMFTTSFGTIPCIVYDDGDILYYVGAEDGLLYRFSDGTVSYEVIGTSLVSDAPMSHYDGPLDDIAPGSRFMYSFTRMTYKVDGILIDSVTSQLFTVTDVDGNRISCTVSTYPDDNIFTYVGGEENLWKGSIPNPMSINSVKVIPTPMGNRLCLEYSDIHYTLHLIGLYDSVEYGSEFFLGDIHTTRCLSVMTATELTRDSVGPMDGDVLIFDDGTGKVQLGMCVPDYWTYTDSSWDVGFIPMDPCSDVVTETIDTVYGELECSRYTVDDGDVTVWMYGPLQIPMRFAFDDGRTWDLEFSNLGIVLER